MMLQHLIAAGLVAAIAAGCGLRTDSAADLTGSVGPDVADAGVAPGSDGTKRLVETVGHANAREIFFTGRRYSAAEAMAMGLVHRVYPVGEVESAVRGIAQGLAENAPLTIAASKAVIEEFVRPSGEPDLARGLAAIERCATSEDYVEGRQAFMQKRKPRFRGR